MRELTQYRWVVFRPVAPFAMPRAEDFLELLEHPSYFTRAIAQAVADEHFPGQGAQVCDPRAWPHPIPTHG